MHLLHTHPSNCDPEAGTCGSWVVYPYFMSFYVIVSTIMLNLFTAVIIENFERQQEQVGRVSCATQGLGSCCMCTLTL